MSGYGPRVCNQPPSSYANIVGSSDQPHQGILEQTAAQIHRSRPTGTDSLAKSLLQAWGMDGVGQATVATVMGKGIEILVPPCGRAITAALGLSTEIATIQRDISAPTTLSCLIRIDDRLASKTSQSSQHEGARMQTLKAILKQCAAGTHFGFTLFPAPPGMTSGHWFANHFDVAYLDRRCYEQENAMYNKNVVPFSVVDMLKEKCGPAAATTGALLLLDNEVMGKNLQALQSTGSASTMPPIREWQMFEVKLQAPNSDAYAAGYFGEFVLGIPAKLQVAGPHQDMPQDYRERLEREQFRENENKKAMNEMRSASDVKGFLKAGFKFGKNKLGQFMDEQKRMGAY